MEGAVEPDCGDESGNMRADFGGTSGGSSDTTLCSLNLLTAHFGTVLLSGTQRAVGGSEVFAMFVKRTEFLCKD